MYEMKLEAVVEPYQRAIREKNIPSLRRGQAQNRELQLIRLEQRSSAGRRTGLGARIAALWALVTARQATAAKS